MINFQPDCPVDRAMSLACWHRLRWRMFWWILTKSTPGNMNITGTFWVRLPVSGFLTGARCLVSEILTSSNAKKNKCVRKSIKKQTFFMWTVIPKNQYFAFQEALKAWWRHTLMSQGNPCNSRVDWCNNRAHPAKITKISQVGQKYVYFHMGRVTQWGKQV